MRSKRAASTPRSAARAATRSGRARRSASSRCATPTASGIPKNQRPELWHLLNSRIRPGESIRVFPLSNWTEIDVWQLHPRREHPDRAALFRQGARGDRPRRLADHRSSSRSCRCCRARSRSASCAACARSAARRAPARCVRRPTRCRRSSTSWSRRATPSASCAIIDHDQDGSMELKKREGYF